MILLLFACTAPDTAALDDTAPRVDTADTSDTASPPTDVAFRYAVIADPHVTTPTGDHVDRLDRAVAWIAEQAPTRDLRFVLVLGDIAWSDGFGAARASLDRLPIPYVPINGDNEVQLGAEEAYDLAFADQYVALADTFEAWEMGAVQVDNPEQGVPSWFHNLAFTYEGVRFIGLDWASREIGGLQGEFGVLHDFEGGTWPFFEAQVAAAATGPTENVVMFSHIPMHFGTFDLDQLERIRGVTAPVGDHVWADLAGHYHASASETVPDAGYDLHVTDAVWDDEIEVRIVEVRADATRFAPVTELVIVP